MSRTMNHTNVHGHDDFEIEPVEGLPEAPPKGERILWQGRPDTLALAVAAFKLKWVAGYFGLLVLWRFVTMVDQLPLGHALGSTVPFIFLGAVACGLLWLMAFVQARATMYTITDARVVMRIGAALTLTLNLPYRQIANAMLDLRPNGTGTIALETMGDTRLSYFVCWPHARPWTFNPTQPALRAIADAEYVAQLLGQTAETRIAVPQVVRIPGPEQAAHTVAAE